MTESLALSSVHLQAEGPIYYSNGQSSPVGAQPARPHGQIVHTLPSLAATRPKAMENQQVRPQLKNVLKRDLSSHMLWFYKLVHLGPKYSNRDILCCPWKTSNKMLRILENLGFTFSHPKGEVCQKLAYWSLTNSSTTGKVCQYPGRTGPNHEGFLVPLLGLL